jgi:hypothetical protein
MIFIYKNNIMKTRQLAKLLETIVRKVVREEFKSLLNESTEQKPKVKQKQFDPFDVSHIFESQNHNKKPQKKMEFSKDNMVNQILNETYEANEWQNINGNGGMFTSQQAQGFNRSAMAEMMGYGSGKPTVSNMTPTTDPDGRPMNVNLEGTKVGEALTRDYSALMKKINAKKGK